MPRLFREDTKQWKYSSACVPQVNIVFQQKKSRNGIGWHWLPKWHDRRGAQRIERIPELAWILVRWDPNQCHRSVLILLLSNNLLERYYFWLIGWLIFVLQLFGRAIGHVVACYQLLIFDDVKWFNPLSEVVSSFVTGAIGFLGNLMALLVLSRRNIRDLFHRYMVTILLSFPCKVFHGIELARTCHSLLVSHYHTSSTWCPWEMLEALEGCSKWVSSKCPSSIPT